MIRLAEVIKTFMPDLEHHYGDRLLPGQHQALTAIQNCRTGACGIGATQCHDCEACEVFPLSCGHRFCPRCQHQAGESWLERQRAKLLPTDYYMITFTLPEALRPLVYANQREAYDLLIRLAWQTLAQFGVNDKALHGDIGATIVLHTHTRALDFHPHVHVVLPAGAIDPNSREWRTKQDKFLFPHKALAKVFRGKWLAAMHELGWTVKAELPKHWVVDCKHVGNGDKALIYLGRYLYRGVLPEKNILRCENGQVTFRYTDNTGTHRTRTLAGAEFLWLLLRHVLPKGFRRSRDYGFLNANCKQLIQLLLVLRVTPPQPKEKPPLCCKHCGGSVTVWVFPFLRYAEVTNTTEATAA
ncbi:transposase [Gammaproteobacteria bacterium]